MLLILLAAVKSLSHVRLFAAPWTIAYQAPPSMEFSRQEYWSGLPFPSPEDLPNPGMEPGSPAFQADTLLSEPPGKSLEVYASFLFQSLTDNRDIKLRGNNKAELGLRRRHIWFTAAPSLPPSYPERQCDNGQ